MAGAPKRRMKIASSIYLTKHGRSATYARQFVACVRIGKEVSRSTLNVVCGDGRTPRAAVAAALKKMSSRVAERKGAFKGVR